MAATQYLYTVNVGGPSGEPAGYARYSLPDLKFLEMTPATGETNIAFGKGGLPYFVDAANGPQQTGFGVFAMPLSNGMGVPAVEQFYGLCGFGSGDIGSYKFATGPTGDFYAIQICTNNVGEWKPAQNGKMENPFVTFSGGNIGPGKASPSAIGVDSNGGLYVGDAGGGVTYFKPGSKTPQVALPTGCCGGAIYQLTPDTNGNMWTTYDDGPTSTFKNDNSCTIDPNGSIERSEVGEVFSRGKLVEHLYSIPEADKKYNIDGTSIAVDSKGRAYLSLIVPNSSVLEYPPGTSCPDSTFNLNGQYLEDPQVAVDEQDRFYVTDSTKNSITAYNSASTKPRASIVQPKGVFDPIDIALGPP
jgi:streptogramin lyase